MNAHDNENTPPPLPDSIAESLIRTAIGLGAAEVVMVPSSTIVIEDHLAALCNGNPPCPNYGLAPSCPPHVPGPSAFRQWQRKSPWCVVIRMDFPPTGLSLEERQEIGRLLHEMASGVEHRAMELGYPESRAFAGGSCKHIFCSDHDSCQVLSGKGPCRYPQTARPSVSGFGINVAKLMESACWKEPPDPASMSWLVGLVLLM